MQLQSFSCLWPPDCCCNWENRAGSQNPSTWQSSPSLVPPPFLITVEGSCGLPDPVRCFHGPNVRPLCCCVLLLFLWYNSRIKSVTEIKKKWSQCVEYWFHDFVSFISNRRLFYLPSPPGGTVALFSDLELLCLNKNPGYFWDNL